MKPVAVVGTLVIAGIGGLLVWTMARGGACGGAPVYRSAEACAAAGRPAALCARMMGEADAKLAASGPVHNSREQCEEHFVTCQRSMGPTGFVPRASGFCVTGGERPVVVPVFGRSAGG